MKTKSALISSALAVTLCGCVATAEPGVSALKPRPAPTTGHAGVTPSDLFYGDAVAAINRRDYARALDLLQAARDNAPHDVRILNAFGVVYDKLGRFDLSQRYYATAQAVDPASAIVAQNLAYSKALQGDSAAFALAETPELKTAVPPASIERASSRLAQAQLRRDVPVMTTEPAPPTAPAPAAVSPRTGPVRIVAPMAVAYASEPFVVRVPAGSRGASIEPLARPEFIAAAPAWSTPTPRPETRPALAAATATPVSLAVNRKVAVRTPAATVSTPAPVAPRAAAGASAPRTFAQEAPIRVAVAPSRAPVAPAVAPARAPERAPTGSHGRIVQVSTRGPAAVAATRPTAAVSAARKFTLAAPRTTPPSPHRLPATAQPSRADGLLGRPVTVVYSGSGRRSAAQLRTQLARRGWTLALANSRAAAPSVTTVRYAANSQRVALALARSLRIPVKLEACRSRCLGVTILVGGQGVMRTAAAANRQPRKIS